MAATERRPPASRAAPWCAAAAAAAALAFAADGRASAVDAAMLYYADTDHVSVASPHVAGSIDVGHLSVGLAAAVDVISAASTDIVTAASPDGFDEVRVEGSARAAYELREGRSVAAHGSVSHEPDYEAWSAGAAVQWDVADRAATLGLGYTLSLGEAGRVDDTAFRRTKRQHRIDLGVAPILSPAIVLDLSYGLTVVDGYQANPYRFVRLYAPGASAHATGVLEQVPSDRVRHAATARLRFRVARPLYGLVEHQAYVDTWGMWAGAVRARATLALGAWSFGLDARLYRQTGVAFYRRRYSVEAPVPTWRTADKELGSMWTARIGPRVDWTARPAPLDSLRIGLGVDLHRMRYLDFAYLDGRTAVVASVDAAVGF